MCAFGASADPSPAHAAVTCPADVVLTDNDAHRFVYSAAAIAAHHGARVRDEGAILHCAVIPEGRRRVGRAALARLNAVNVPECPRGEAEGEAAVSQVHCEPLGDGMPFNEGDMCTFWVTVLPPSEEACFDL